MDDKQSKFLRTAEKRTAEVIRRIRTLKRCANTKTYDYTLQQVNQMFDAIDEAIDDARDAFELQALFSFDDTDDNETHK